MRGKIKTTRKKASKLHGADARYVSLVDRGASETPFTLIKSKEHGASAMSIKKRKKTAKSHKAVAGAKKKAEEKSVQTETVIAKMVFDGEVFETEEAVRDWIEKAEWETGEGEEIVVKQIDDGFEATIDGVDEDDFVRTGEVEIDDEGVQAFVGEREVEAKEDEASDDDTDDDDKPAIEPKADDTSEEEEDEAEEEEEEPAPEPKAKEPAKKSKRAEFLAKRAEARKTEKKFDAWDAMFSSGNTLAKSLKDGIAWDGIPPGVAEVQLAFNATIGNILGSDDGDKQDMLNKAAADYAEIIGGLDTFFDAYVEADEETVAKTFEDEKAREALMKWADGYGDFVEGVEPTPEPVAKSVDGTPVAIDYKQIGTTVAGVLSKSFEPLIEQIGAVSETVEAMASRAPTKKAVDPDDTGAAGDRKVKTKKQNGDDAMKRFGKTFMG